MEIKIRISLQHGPGVSTRLSIYWEPYFPVAMWSPLWARQLPVPNLRTVLPNVRTIFKLWVCPLQTSEEQITFIHLEGWVFLAYYKIWPKSRMVLIARYLPLVVSLLQAPSQTQQEGALSLSGFLQMAKLFSDFALYKCLSTGFPYLSVSQVGIAQCPTSFRKLPEIQGRAPDVPHAAL